MRRVSTCAFAILVFSITIVAILGTRAISVAAREPSERDARRIFELPGQFVFAGLGLIEHAKDVSWRPPAKTGSALPNGPNDDDIEFQQYLIYEKARGTEAATALRRVLGSDPSAIVVEFPLHRANAKSRRAPRDLRARLWSVAPGDLSGRGFAMSDPEGSELEYLVGNLLLDVAAWERDKQDRLKQVRSGKLGLGQTSRLGHGITGLATIVLETPSGPTWDWIRSPNPAASLGDIQEVKRTLAVRYDTGMSERRELKVSDPETFAQMDWFEYWSRPGKYSARFAQDPAKIAYEIEDGRLTIRQRTPYTRLYQGDWIDKKGKTRETVVFAIEGGMEQDEFTIKVPQGAEEIRISPKDMPPVMIHGEKTIKFE